MNSVYILTAQGTDIDSFGHVNNSVYIRYLECARWNFFHDNGLLENTISGEMFPVILETSIRYIKEIHMLDKVRIDTQWTCMGGVVCNVHRIYNDQTDVLFAKAKCKLAFVSKDRIICDIPLKVKELIEGNIG